MIDNLRAPAQPRVITATFSDWRTVKGRPKRMPVLDRLMSWAETVEGDCWEWQGYRNQNGYGRIKVGRAMQTAHKIAYQLLVGPIPDGHELDHLCRNRGCINPLHLEPVSHKENVRRGNGGAAQRAQTHCKSGHPFDEENTGRRATGGRFCKECGREAVRKRRARLRGASL